MLSDFGPSELLLKGENGVDRDGKLKWGTEEQSLYRKVHLSSVFEEEENIEYLSEQSMRFSQSRRENVPQMDSLATSTTIYAF